MKLFFFFKKIFYIFYLLLVPSLATCEEITSKASKTSDALRAEFLLQMGIDLLVEGGFETNEKKAYEYFLKAALLGSPHAQYQTGLSLKFGFGDVRRDPYEACKWFEKASDQKEELAFYYTFICYNEGTLLTFYKEKLLALQKLAEVSHYKEVQYSLALKFGNRNSDDFNPVKKLIYLEKAAEAGHHSAAYDLSEHYLIQGANLKAKKFAKFAENSDLLSVSAMASIVLSAVLVAEKKFLEAEKKLDFVLEREELFKEKSLTALLDTALYSKAVFLRDRGRLDEAIVFFNKVIKSNEEHFGTQNNDYLLHILLEFASFLSFTNEFEAAEKQAVHGLNIALSQPKIDEKKIIQFFIILLGVYADLGERELSEKLLSQMNYYLEKIDLKTENDGDIGRAFVGAGNSILNFGIKDTGDIRKAFDFYKSAERIFENAGWDESPFLAAAKHNIGLVLYLQTMGKLKPENSEAIKYLKEAILISEKVENRSQNFSYFNLSPHSTSSSLQLIGNIYFGAQKFEEANEYYDRAILEEKKNPLGERAGNFLAKLKWSKVQVALRSDNYDLAFEILSELLPIIENNQKIGWSKSENELLHSSQFISRNAYEILGIYLTKKTLSPEDKNNILKTIQLSKFTKTSYAVSQLSKRHIKRDKNFADLVKKQQDLKRAIASTKGKYFSYDLIKNANKAEANKTKIYLKKLEVELKVARSSMMNEYSNILSLQISEPLDHKTIVDFLQEDEAILITVQGSKANEGYIVVFVSKNDFHFFKTLMSKEEIQKLVKEIRKSLDLRKSKEATRELPKFDLEASSILYNQIFSLQTQNINHLYVIPDGDLEELPFQILVKEFDASELNQFIQYRKASWLANEYSISRLPSLQSLKTFVDLPSEFPLNAGFIGFGNPSLNSVTASLRGIKIIELDTKKEVNLDILRNLPAIPNSSRELGSLAEIFSPNKNQIFIGEQATESILKKIDLSETGIIAFSTHGISAGELGEGFEPALVLTPPKKSSGNDDGLLLSSEIFDLNLDADLVILSACNTASGLGDVEDGLSGLARSFIYAGAKAVLISHWAIETDSAELLTRNFASELHEGSKLSLARALQNSMQSLINHKIRKEFSHPAFWAPFTLVGGAGK